MSTLRQQEINLNGETYTVYKTTLDGNGNPRYFISFLTLGLEKYESTKATRKAGLTKYNGKNFGGGFVFTSYNVKDDLIFILNTLNQNGGITL